MVQLGYKFEMAIEYTQVELWNKGINIVGRVCDSQERSRLQEETCGSLVSWKYKIMSLQLCNE